MVLYWSCCMKTVADLVSQYDTRSNSSKTRKWLHKTSETICHYGTVLDVFVQHNPEYVSLVWGTFKLLFYVSIPQYKPWALTCGNLADTSIPSAHKSAVNHAETLKLPAKSTSQIAMRLPKIKTLSKLYAGPQMRQAVEDLYVCILEFLLIGYSWVAESKLKHFYHSFTRPVKLQYDDRLGSITDCSNNIIETRRPRVTGRDSALDTADRHRETQIEELTGMVSRLETSSERQEQKINLILSLLEASGLGIVELLARADSEHSSPSTGKTILVLTAFSATCTLLAGALLDTNQQLSRPQLDQILSTLSSTFQDPDQVYKDHLFLRNRRRATAGRQSTATNLFWLSPQLKAWSSTNKSALVIVKGAFNSHPVIQDFGTSVIHALSSSSAGLSTVWALPGVVSGHAAETNVAPRTLTPSGIFKCLCYQLLWSISVIPTERTICIRHAQFQSASTVRDWLDLFKQLVSSHPAEQLYVIVDMSLVAATATDRHDFNLLRDLSQMLI
ncbi:hypothetical protein V8F33_002281 [Rhypophila sp. PSN 637]